MYDKLLEKIEGWINLETTSTEGITNYLDLILKIKTIQAMDVSAELIRESRKVSRN